MAKRKNKSRRTYIPPDDSPEIGRGVFAQFINSVFDFIASGRVFLIFGIASAFLLGVLTIWISNEDLKEFDFGFEEVVSYSSVLIYGFLILVCLLLIVLNRIQRKIFEEEIKRLAVHRHKLERIILRDRTKGSKRKSKIIEYIANTSETDEGSENGSN